MFHLCGFHDYSEHSMTHPMDPATYIPHMIFVSVKLITPAYVGCNSVLLPGVVIEERLTIGRMTLCTKSAEEWSDYTGVPALIIGERK